MSISELLAGSGALRVFDLGRPLVAGMPQSPNHPPFRHVLERRHGDRLRADGGSAAADLLTTGCHVGTHIDALAHVSHCGRLYGDIDAAEAQQGGSFEDLGIDSTPPIVGRGVLLDVPAALGIERCPPGGEITVADLEATAEHQATAVRDGDAILIRSGWGSLWADRDAYVGRDSGVPGVAEAGARWLADLAPAAVGSDTIAFEQIRPGRGHAVLPAHRVLLVEHGINIIETLDLESLASESVHEFLLVVSHLNIVGATGAPVRPLALVDLS